MLEEKVMIIFILEQFYFEYHILNWDFYVERLDFNFVNAVSSRNVLYDAYGLQVNLLDLV